MRYLIVLLLAGCAQNPIQTVWAPPQSLWEGSRNQGIWLKDRDGKNHKFISAQMLSTLLDAKERIERVSAVKADLAIVETQHPNAFAWKHEGKNYVGFSVSFLESEAGRDRDVLGTTMGHEYAHLHHDHMANRKGREAGRQAAGFALGFLLGPVGILADLGNTAVFNSFTKDEEVEADATGMDWAVEAGFDPCGRARMARIMAKLGPTSMPFFSTHPEYAERVSVANDYSMKRSGIPCS